MSSEGRALSVWLSVLLLTFPTYGQQPVSKLNLVIVEGEGAINNTRQRVSREPIVQVEDENRKPVAGATVTFFLPNQGPGGTFADGSRTFTTTTDANGRAVARGIRPNGTNGQYQIRVSASHQGQLASATIAQTNAFALAAATAGGLGMGKLIAILAIAGGAAAGGAIAATRGGSSPASSGPIQTVLAPGTPTVGAPR